MDPNQTDQTNQNPVQPVQAVTSATPVQPEPTPPTMPAAPAVPPTPQTQPVTPPTPETSTPLPTPPTPSEQTTPTPPIIQPEVSANPTEATTEDKEVQIGKYKVKVIRSKCIGAASCVAVSPTTFQLDNENKAVIQEGSTDIPENILMAAQSCPTKAIVIIDTETGQQVWPV